MTDVRECTVKVRYRPGAVAGDLPWTVVHESGRRVLTITDLEDSPLGVLLSALARAGELEPEPSSRPAG